LGQFALATEEASELDGQARSLVFDLWRSVFFLALSPPRPLALSLSRSPSPSLCLRKSGRIHAQPLHQAARRIRRRPSQFPKQNALHLPILIPRGGGLSRSGIEPHHLDVRLFAERVRLHGPTGIRDGGFQVASLFQARRQTADGPEEKHGQAPLFGQHPVFVIAGQQFAAIEFHRLREMLRLFLRALRLRRRPERALEFRHVRRHGGGIQAHGGAVHGEDGSGRHARRLQLAAQGGEGHAQTVAARLREAARPQEFDQHLAGMREEMVGQICEQRAGLLRAEPGDDAVRPNHSQSAEEFNSAMRVHRSPSELGRD
jgi:hypothetical protein